jgi:hypothetical protein
MKGPEVRKADLTNLAYEDIYAIFDDRPVAFCDLRYLAQEISLYLRSSVGPSE